MVNLPPEFWKNKILAELGDREALTGVIDGLWLAHETQATVTLQYWWTRLDAINFLIGNLDKTLNDPDKKLDDNDLKRLTERRLALMALRSDTNDALKGLAADDAEAGNQVLFDQLNVTGIIEYPGYGPDPNHPFYRGMPRPRGYNRWPLR